MRRGASYKTVKLLSKRAPPARVCSGGMSKIPRRKSYKAFADCWLYALARYYKETLCVPEIGIPQQPLRAQQSARYVRGEEFMSSIWTEELTMSKKRTLKANSGSCLFGEKIKTMRIFFKLLSLEVFSTRCLGFVTI